MGDQTDGDRAYQANMHDAPVAYVPWRVVSLVPCLTEALFDLDLGDRLVGISEHSGGLPDRATAITHVGSPLQPNLEKIVTLEPDLILANRDENRPDVVDALRATGLPVWLIEPRTVFDALNVLWHMMDVFDHAVMVPRVREIERAYDYTLAASSAQAPVRVFVPTWRDPWMTFSAQTYPRDLIRICGGIVVPDDSAQSRDTGDDSPPGPGDDFPYAHDERLVEVTMDQILSAQPEVVLLPDLPYGFTETDAAWFRRLEFPAAQSDRCVVIDGSLLTWFGTRIAYALRDLPGLVMGGG